MIEHIAHPQLNPLLKWPGGKFFQAKRIVALMPEHDMYIEPFAGGASVYLTKHPAKYNVLNDKVPWLVGMYRVVSKYGAVLNCQPARKTRENLHILRDKFTEIRSIDDPDEFRPEWFCDVVNLNRLSFHGNMHDLENERPDRFVATSVFSNLDRYMDRFSKAKIECRDFADVIKDAAETAEHFGISVLAYLDPPWTACQRTIGYSDRFYDRKGSEDGAHQVKFDDVMDVVSQYDSIMYMISIDDCEESREVLGNSGFEMFNMVTSRADPRRSGGRIKATQILATKGFDVPRDIEVPPGPLKKLKTLVGQP